jgi:predicted ABC-type transport system involved in lysophospholipase L1 biosynthesis ATPase subunit
MPIRFVTYPYLAGVTATAAHTRARELLEGFGLGARLRFTPGQALQR